MNVHGSFMHNIQRLDASHVPIRNRRNRLCDAHTVEHHAGIRKPLHAKWMNLEC